MEEKIRTEEPARIKEYEFFKKLMQLPFVEAIYLYGSRARGDHQPSSDLDLAVFCPQATDAEWEQVKSITVNANTLLTVEAVRLDQKFSDAILKSGFKDEIEKCKILLYFKPALWSQDEKNIVRHQLHYWHEYMDKFSYAMDQLQRQDMPEDELRRKTEECAKAFRQLFDHICFAMRIFLKRIGIHASSPLAVLKEAYKEGWIENRLLWEQMITDAGHIADGKGYKWQDFKKRLFLYAIDLRQVMDKVHFCINELGLV